LLLQLVLGQPQVGEHRRQQPRGDFLLLVFEDRAPVAEEQQGVAALALPRDAS